MKEKSFQENLLEFLYRGPAHMSVQKVMEGIRIENRGKKIPKSPTNIWEEFEHMRIAREDILRYTLDPSWKSPQWPEGYWPEKAFTYHLFVIAKLYVNWKFRMRSGIRDTRYRV